MADDEDWTVEVFVATKALDSIEQELDLRAVVEPERVEALRDAVPRPNYGQDLKAEAAPSVTSDWQPPSAGQSQYPAEDPPPCRARISPPAGPAAGALAIPDSSMSGVRTETGRTECSGYLVTSGR